MSTFEDIMRDAFNAGKEWMRYQETSYKYAPDFDEWFASQPPFRPKGEWVGNYFYIGRFEFGSIKQNASDSDAVKRFYFFAYSDFNSKICGLYKYESEARAKVEKELENFWKECGL